MISIFSFVFSVNIEPRSMSMGSSPYVTTKDSSKTLGTTKMSRNESNFNNQINASVNHSMIRNDDRKVNADIESKENQPPESNVNGVSNQTDMDDNVRKSKNGHNGKIPNNTE